MPSIRDLEVDITVNDGDPVYMQDVVVTSRTVVIAASPLRFNKSELWQELTKLASYDAKKAAWSLEGVDYLDPIEEAADFEALFFEVENQLVEMGIDVDLEDDSIMDDSGDDTLLDDDVMVDADMGDLPITDDDFVKNDQGFITTNAESNHAFSAAPATRHTPSASRTPTNRHVASNSSTALDDDDNEDTQELVEWDGTEDTLEEPEIEPIVAKKI